MLAAVQADVGDDRVACADEVHGVEQDAVPMVAAAAEHAVVGQQATIDDAHVDRVRPEWRHGPDLVVREAARDLGFGRKLQRAVAPERRAELVQVQALGRGNRHDDQRVVVAQDERLDRLLDRQPGGVRLAESVRGRSVGEDAVLDGLVLQPARQHLEARCEMRAHRWLVTKRIPSRPSREKPSAAPGRTSRTRRGDRHRRYWSASM